MIEGEYTFHWNPEGIECYSPPMKLGDKHPINATGTLKGFNYNTINIEPLRGSGSSLMPFPPISLGVNNIQSLRDYHHISRSMQIKSCFSMTAKLSDIESAFVNQQSVYP